ncbi:MAG: hypothetical protein WBV21_19645, partial [Desulfobacterales bacterium]
TGASDYLLKPFKPEQLSLALEKIAQQKKLTAEYNYLKGCPETGVLGDAIGYTEQGGLRVI